MRHTSLYDLGRQLSSRLPENLQRELAQGHDRAIRYAMDEVGAPRMDHSVAGALFGAPAGAGEGPRQYGSPNMPVVPDPFVGAGMGAAPGEPAAVPGEPRVRRHPYVIWGGTNLTASVQGLAGNPTTYQNASRYPFVCTHLTMNEGSTNIRLSPSYRVQVNPPGQGKWMNQRVDAMALLTNAPYGPIPNAVGYQAARWQFAAPFIQGRSDSFFIIGRNEGSAALTFSLGLIGYKKNALGTPRVFWDSLAIAALTTSDSILDSQDFKGDGDFDVVLTDLIVTAGGNSTWGVATQAAPLVQVRPGSSDLAFMQVPTSAVGFNNTSGGLGGFWQLATPQRLLPTQSLGIEFDEVTGSAVRANVGLVGYLEIPE